MRKLIVDGKEIEVPADYSVLQACEEAGAEIPRFCFHERLSVAGNCRMCLVEAKGAPKPIASCAFGVSDLRGGANGEPPEILTGSPTVRKAREGVMEFLLINHPLDCPICDQGGECDLQDQAIYYGVDSSRFAENKRAVEDKYIGPLVKTVMTRCIHCTRCVRFTTEVAGVNDLGATGRGENVEITTYLEGAMSSEMQGNVIDLCPVGALTSRPYAFQARPWELTRTETIDVMDAMGCHIRIDSRGNEVMRIMPRQNDLINEEWISDRSRFHWDGLKSQRLDRPYIRENGRLRPASWGEALGLVAEKLENSSSEKIAGIVGEMANVEEMFAFKELMAGIGVTRVESRLNGSTLPVDLDLSASLFNSGFMAVEEADALLIIGSNPRHEATVFNSRIRKRWRMGTFPIAVIGEANDLTYEYEHLGSTKAAVSDLIAGKSAFYETLKNAQKPMIIIGADALADEDGEAVLKTLISLADQVGAITEGWCGFNILQNNASAIGARALHMMGEGGLPAILQDASSNQLDIVFNMGADDLDLKAFENCFTIYMGSHGDAGAHAADVILPAAAYCEKSGTYVNTEGRVQFAQRASFPKGDAREDWSILRALAGLLNINLGFESFEGLCNKLAETHPELGKDGGLLSRDISALKAIAANSSTGSGALNTHKRPYYFANAILRASAIMAECQGAEREQLIAAE